MAIGSGDQALQASYDEVARALRVLLTAGVTVDVGDVELGAVELKDGATNSRAKVTDQPAVETDFGLVVRLVRRGTATDRSGTVTAGGTAQDAAAANTARRYLLIVNPKSSTTRLWFNLGTTAVQASPSIALDPGDSFVQEGMYVDTGRVSIIGPTTGAAFTVKEG